MNCHFPAQKSFLLIFHFPEALQSLSGTPRVMFPESEERIPGGNEIA